MGYWYIQRMSSLKFTTRFRMFVRRSMKKSSVFWQGFAQGFAPWDFYKPKPETIRDIELVSIYKSWRAVGTSVGCAIDHFDSMAPVDDETSREKRSGPAGQRVRA